MIFFALNLPCCLYPIFIHGVLKEGLSKIPELELPIIQAQF